MKPRFLVALVLLAVVAGGCSRLGTGLPSCRAPADDVSAATVLSVQAVPKAEYIPCVNALPLGWEEVNFEVESGKASLEFRRNLDESFLNVTLRSSCDVTGATEVPSGIEDVIWYESIYEVADEITVAIIPDGERARIYAHTLVDDLEGTVVEDRPVVFTVDDDIQYPVRSRVNRAFFNDQYVWIISDLDIDEKTLEMRSTPDGEGVHGIDVHDALERIAHSSEEMQYRGQWYLVFDGGCITYDFDARGALAGSIAEDAELTIGLYPTEELYEAARRAGYELTDE